MLTDIVRVVLQFSASAFAGACLYILLAQHPVRMGAPGATALADFRAAIPRAEKLQAPLLIAGLAAAAVSVVSRFSWPLVVGTTALAAVLVLTLTTVLPINRRLLSGEPADRLDEAPAALLRWGRLHAVRTLVAVVGAVAVLL